MTVKKLTTLENFEDMEKFLLSKIKIIRLQNPQIVDKCTEEERDEWDRKADEFDINEITIYVFECSQLPERLQHLLVNNKINTIGDLAQKSKQDLLKLKFFGRKYLGYVNKTLESVGVSLRQEEDEY